MQDDFSLGAHQERMLNMMCMGPCGPIVKTEEISCLFHALFHVLYSNRFLYFTVIGFIFNFCSTLLVMWMRCCSQTGTEAVFIFFRARAGNLRGPYCF